MREEQKLRNPLADHFRKIFMALAIVCIAGSVFGQTHTSDFKADKNLKSSARINPSTLAMEFSLPFGAYPGRAGGSLPIGLDYSSKVWTMKTNSFSRRNDGGGGTQQSPLQISTFTSYQPEYSNRAVAGWTSSLQPLSLLSYFEWYGGENSLENQPIECEVTSLTWELDDPDCPGGSLIQVESCSETQSNLAPYERVTRLVCLGDPNDGSGGGPVVGPPTNPGPGSERSFMVKRARVVMPDGSTKEFRQDDVVYDCNEPPGSCEGQSYNGTYISVDGSGMRLVIGEDQGNEVFRNVIYSPDGSRYLIDGWNGSSELIDKNGNKTVYNAVNQEWTDTMGRELSSPLKTPNVFYPVATVGTISYPIPAMDGQTRQVEQEWQKLVHEECVNGNESACQNNAIDTTNFSGNPNSKLKSLGTDTCENIISTMPTLNPTSGTPLFTHVPAEDDPPPGANGTNPAIDFKHHFVICGNTFNPVVLKSIKLPDGSKYQFRYNEYGEMSKITYPTGAHERFLYGTVAPVSTIPHPYALTNRGVVERWVSEDGVNETQNWKYHNVYAFPTSGDTVIVNTTITPDDTKTVSTYAISAGSYTFGFENPLAGQSVEEKVYSKRENLNDPETARTLLKRSLTEWITEEPRAGGHQMARRDPRVAKSISIIFENGKALATLNTTEYDENGHNDPEYFSHLNPKRQKSYHFKVLSLNMAETADIATIVAEFNSETPASITETDYEYDEVPGYKARGILGRPIETRVMDPAYPTDVSKALSKTQLKYDEGGDYALISESTATGWTNPNSLLRGNVTTRKTLLKDPITGNQSWIETHARYDFFGNLREAWDAAGNKVTTVYEDSPNKFAYPSTVIAPAPDPTDTHGSNQTSVVSTTYDFNTGLVKTMTDIHGQVTTTEYNDSMLRPTKVESPNGAQVVTEYGQPNSIGVFPESQMFVKVKKQIDELNWEEATTFTDGLGRTVKTRAKDSQGYVETRTIFDALGRVEKTSNPYRVNANGEASETVYWSSTRYDEQNRVVETYAPASSGTGTSLGTTSFDISTVPGYVGTVVVSTDASGRKGRSITNALDQLIRVDEPTVFGGTVTNDLGTLEEPNQLTFYKYNALGKMIEVTQGVQKRYFLYDNLGRLRRIKQPEQQANTGLTPYTDPLTDNPAWSAEFTYDIRGNVLTTTDANGTVITNTYDSAGRVKTRTYTPTPGQGVAATPPVSYFYDGKGVTGANFVLGKLTKVTSDVSETRYTNFDQMGRVLSSEQITDGQTYPSKYKYNLTGSLIEQTYPSGEVVRNFHESDGDLSRVSMSGQTYASDFKYTVERGVKAVKLGNGRWETALFNHRQQTTQLGLGTAESDTSFWRVNYEYGELLPNGNVDGAQNTGNIAKQTLTIPGIDFVQTYKYDASERLTEAQEKTGVSQNWIQGFGYDRYGNRTSFSQQIGSVTENTTPTVNPNTNRLSNQGFVYDKNGNLINDGEGTNTRSFSFDGENKQTVVSDYYGAVKGRYFYDGQGKRIKKIAYENAGNEEKTVFVYDALGKLVAEYSNQISSSPTISYTTTDHLGSPRVITDKAGNVTARRDFMPFGEELKANTPNRGGYPVTSDTIRKKFTGYEQDDETGLDFAEARYYSKNHGRFTAVDPLLASGKSSDPQTFNRYAYVLGNPITMVDKNGLYPVYYRVYKENGHTITYYGRIQRFGGQEYKGPPVIVRERGYKIVVTSSSITYYKNGRVVEPPPPLPKSNDTIPGANDPTQGEQLAREMQRRAPVLHAIVSTAGLIAAVTVAAPVAVLSGPTLGAGAAAGAAEAAAEVTVPTVLGGGPIGPAAAFSSAALAGTAAGELAQGNTEPSQSPSVPLWRGVKYAAPGTPGYEQYQLALQGIAVPRGWPNGHSNPAAHSAGQTANSNFTSWTYDPYVAQEFAGPNGVILSCIFFPEELIESPGFDDEAEYEVLIQGPVTDAVPVRRP